MNTSAHQSRNEQASENTDASFSDVLTAWEKVYQSIRLKMRINADLIAADFRLTIRALVVSLICILSLVGLALLTWCTALVALCLGLTQLGIHWGWCVLVVLLCNGLGIVFIKNVLSKALAAIEMKASCASLLDQTKKE
ncbi:hypothetical protein [Paraglaciecola sp. L3A3]|uniref:hypothetical protein n=1 Tax=Paraglaciecola sp. L3A3 TaxID=2686358 RepID=UPI00131E4AF2|nr:hypothetical protein [Paraglaciecola sp. L3A3]